MKNQETPIIMCRGVLRINKSWGIHDGDLSLLLTHLGVKVRFRGDVCDGVTNTRNKVVLELAMGVGNLYYNVVCGVVQEQKGHVVFTGEAGI